MSIKRSPLMDQLYGVDKSIEVFNTLEGLNPLLNKEVQEIAYDHFWARPGLSVKDKSFVTVVALISLGKVVQAKTHMIGFINTGGTREEILNALVAIANAEKNLAQKGLDVLIDVLQELEKNTDIANMKSVFNDAVASSKSRSISLNKKYENFIRVTFCAAVGEQSKTIESIQKFLEESGCTESDLENIFIHLIAYCGFPVAVNAFSALKKAKVSITNS